MSCGSLCPCQFSWALDTHGDKKDTISSEKAWLDFAVRYLSRKAAGKGNGQETVWSVAPSWWDSNVGLPWKNPTTNPKDNKDVLLRKYKALEEHLRKENRFPSDLEEEAKLWASGKHKELFLLCNLTSLLRKVSGVHLAIEEASSKVDKMKAQINQDVLDNIRNCLSSALKATERFKQKDQPKQLKRSHNDRSDNVQAVPCKKSKYALENDKRLVPILPKPDKTFEDNSNAVSFVPNISLQAKTSEAILEYAHKILEKRKSITCQTKLNVNKIPTVSFAKNNNHQSQECHQTSISEINSDPINVTCSPSSFMPSSLQLDIPESSLDDFAITLQDSSISGQISNNISTNFDSEIDFLLSPIGMKQNIEPHLNNSCLNTDDISFVGTSKENFNFENEVVIENLSDVVPLGQGVKMDAYVPNEIANSECRVNPNDPPSFILDSNNSSPHSIVSETNSCPLTNSDGGYISADDLNFDIDELITMTDDTAQWDEMGPFSPERILFDTFDELPDSNSGVSLLDQWADSYNMTDS